MRNSLDNASRLEVLLFSEGGPVPKKRLMQLLELDTKALTDVVSALRASREGSGLALVETENEVALTVAPDAAETVEKAFEKELGREIGDAGLEVLAILLYTGPSTRARIDYIRGVNTSWTIRALAARGLVERIPNPEDAREYLYRPTTELLAHIGADRLEHLPEYAKIAGELAAFEQKRGPFEDHADTRDEPAA
jgi:segregation and condensation protein B